MSVIVLTGADPTVAAATLQSLVGQTVADRLEVILVCKAAAPSEPLGAPAPSFAFRSLSWAANDAFGQIRARAVRQCRAPVVAFLEDHSLADPLWAESYLRAHLGPWAGVGGEPHNGNPGIGISDAVDLMNFLAWLPPTERRQDRMLAGHNASYKRHVLLAYGPSLDLLLRSDTVLNMKLAADGHKLLVEPAAKFSHANESTVPSIVRGYYTLSRSIGSTRAEVFDWSLGHRLWRATLWPLVPVRRIARLLLTLARSHPHRLPRALGFLPHMAVAWTATALGQAAGYLFGLGDADYRFLVYETESQRGLPADGIRPPPASVASPAAS